MPGNLIWAEFVGVIAVALPLGSGKKIDRHSTLVSVLPCKKQQASQFVCDQSGQAGVDRRDDPL